MLAGFNAAHGQSANCPRYSWGKVPIKLVLELVVSNQPYVTYSQGSYLLHSFADVSGVQGMTIGTTHRPIVDTSDLPTGVKLACINRNK